MNIPAVKIAPDFAAKLPEYRLLTIVTDVAVTPTTPATASAMKELEQKIADTVELPEINKIPAIAATRRAYKICGKDPNRYRPSQEQLMRRIVRGLGLYTVNEIVDRGNILSLSPGCAVGCFDLAKIEGDEITVDTGREGEPYEGIGRGEINIGGMPLIRDAAGPFGTPTSDTPRTMVTPSTTRLLVTLHLFDPAADAEDITRQFRRIFAPVTMEWKVTDAATIL